MTNSARGLFGNALRLFRQCLAPPPEVARAPARALRPLLRLEERRLLSGTPGLLGGMINVNPAAGLQTTEAGGTATFFVTLSTAPLLGLTVNVSSSAPAEGTANAASLSFNGSNWNQPQAVVVTGHNDGINQPDQPYTINLSAGSLLDLTFAGA